VNPEQLPLPRYRSHKVVKAAKIVGVASPSVIVEIRTPGQPNVTCLAVDMPPAWFTKHEPQAGGYLVVYEDGYASFSPAAAFESGYYAVDEAAEADRSGEAEGQARGDDKLPSPRA
jgi:hypothetical protein